MAFAFAPKGGENFAVELCDMDNHEVVARIKIGRNIYFSLTQEELAQIIEELKDERGPRWWEADEEVREPSTNSENTPNQ